MTEAMGMDVSHSIAVQLGAIQKSLQTPALSAICFAKFGETGILYVAASVRPAPSTGKRHRSSAVQGKWVIWGKVLFEQYFMTKMRLGAAVLWYERPGLRMMFGVDWVKPIAASPPATPARA